MTPALCRPEIRIRPILPIWRAGSEPCHDAWEFPPARKSGPVQSCLSIVYCDFAARERLCWFGNMRRTFVDLHVRLVQVAIRKLTIASSSVWPELICVLTCKLHSGNLINENPCPSILFTCKPGGGSPRKKAPKSAAPSKTHMPSVKTAPDRKQEEVSR